VVAADPEQVEEVTQAIFGGFVSAFVAVLLLGVIGAIALSHALVKKVAIIRRTAEAIVEGDLKRRIPRQRNSDDFDLLSQTLNHMLDRISELMESLRHISANIAHDLKTPLAHLRNRLENMRELPARAQSAAIEDAVSRVDDILTTFGALLRIAQIEAGTRRGSFADLDLGQLCQSVVETFTPAAEDAGQHMQTRIAAGVTIQGDRELLTQALANLIENAIRHTPAGTTITLSLGRDNDHASVSIADTGPGIPTAELPQVFQRFYRGTNAKDRAGTGLGLSLVKAVAELHGGTVEATNTGPGLAITLNIPIEDTH
jgi:signal transduction histidine kinase